MRSIGDKDAVSDFLATPARQAAVVETTAHRPWPLPDGPWANAQTWDDLAFLHWRVDAAAVRALVPEGLEVELHDGSAWLGITPFRLSGFRVRGLPPLPLVSSFAELDVRTEGSRRSARVSIDAVATGSPAVSATVSRCVAWLTTEDRTGTARTTALSLS